MAKKAELERCMKVVVDRLNELGPDVAPEWGGSVQFVFPDLHTGWLLKVAMDGTVESCIEKIDEEAATGVIETDSDTWVDVINKKIHPSEAKASGKIQVRKSIEALIKILPLVV